MTEKEYTKRGRACLRRVLLAALLLAALGAGAANAGVWQNQATASDDEIDTAFAYSVKAMTDELSSILKSWPRGSTTGSDESEYVAIRSVGTNLSTRSRYWYDTLDAMPVSARFADSKRFLLLGLREFESAGNATVQGMDLYLGGNETAAVAVIIEAGNYADRGTAYFRTANDLFPKGGGPPVTPAVTVTGPTPAPVAPDGRTVGPPRAWGKRYAVGNPGTYLGTRAGQDGNGNVTARRRAVDTAGPGLRPGGVASGVTPPKGPFVRWYPGERWRAGIR